MKSCPDNHKWYACKHEELANPLLGFIIMVSGALLVLIGLTEIIR